jgi:integrase
MASLHVRHSRQCARFGPDAKSHWTKADDLKGCTCKKRTYYAVFVRDNKQVRERVGTDKDAAKAAVGRITSELHTGEYERIQDIRFDEWADKWHASLRRPKPSTLRAYKSTLAYGKQAFGGKKVRALTVADISRFVDLVSASAGPSTARKHLRVLHACLRAAVRARYAARNPVADLEESQRPQHERQEAAHFADEELTRLIPQIRAGTHRTLFLLSLGTGLRIGEACALTWGDVDLIEATIRVRRSWTDGQLLTPKNRQRRDVPLSADMVDLLGKWWREKDHPADNNTLVFPANTTTGYVNSDSLRKRILYPAMERAKVPREDVHGVSRTWHSLRHSFARIALERGASMLWVSRTMGHSSLAVTEQVYAHFSKAGARAEAAKLDGFVSAL